MPLCCAGRDELSLLTCIYFPITKIVVVQTYLACDMIIEEFFLAVSYHGAQLLLGVCARVHEQRAPAIDSRE